MASAHRGLITPQEYLAQERKASDKSEYISGEVVSRPAANRRHNLIASNILCDLSVQLRDSACEVYGSDMRVRIGDGDKYVYPDASVACGAPLFEDQELDTLLNPILVVEVLFPTTEKYDRGAKIEAYWRLSSVQECLLVSQDAVRVQRYSLQSSGEWQIVEWNELEDSIQLSSIPVLLRLSEIYRQVIASS